MKAYNMKSNNNNAVANQIVIKNDKEIFFQSYGTTIAKLKNSINGNEVFYTNIILDKDYWDYSRTTTKYLNKFLNKYTAFAIDTKTIKKLIKDDKIKLSDLN